MRVLQRLWNDDAGFIVSAELLLIATIAVIGLIVGLTAVRDAVTSELADVAGAINNVNQSYTVLGIRGHSGSVAGFSYVDQLDFCDAVADPTNADNACIIHTPGLGTNEGAAITAPTGT